MQLLVSNIMVRREWCAARTEWEPAEVWCNTDWGFALHCCAGAKFLEAPFSPCLRGSVDQLPPRTDEQVHLRLGQRGCDCETDHDSAPPHLIKRDCSYMQPHTQGVPGVVMSADDRAELPDRPALNLHCIFPRKR